MCKRSRTGKALSRCKELCNEVDKSSVAKSKTSKNKPSRVDAKNKRNGPVFEGLCSKDGKSKCEESKTNRAGSGLEKLFTKGAEARWTRSGAGGKRLVRTAPETKRKEPVFE